MEKVFSSALVGEAEGRRLGSVSRKVAAAREVQAVRQRARSPWGAKDAFAENSDLVTIPQF